MKPLIKKFIQNLNKLSTFWCAKDQLIALKQYRLYELENVLKELNIYSKLVTKNSFIVACDGIQKQMQGAARSKPDWNTNNPLTAIKKFIKDNKNFKISKNNLIFNESNLNDNCVTYWPNAYIKKVK